MWETCEAFSLESAATHSQQIAASEKTANFWRVKIGLLQYLVSTLSLIQLNLFDSERVLWISSKSICNSLTSVHVLCDQAKVSCRGKEAHYHNRLLALHEYTRFSFSIQGSSFVGKKVEWFSGLMSQYCRAGGRSAARKEWISILLWGNRGG